MDTAGAIIILLVTFVGPFVMVHYVGKGKYRHGWLYALLGGWIGAIILACREPALSPSLKAKQARVREMEIDVLLDARIRELEREREAAQ